MKLTIDEAVPLGAAWVMRMAESCDVRALLIKGEILEQQGLRGQYTSADVDVLVDPEDFDRCLALLAARGWTPMVHSSAPSIIGRHAVTVQNAHWPISIDVHERFPGFLSSSRTVFEFLWSRRTVAQIAGVQVGAPDRIGHAAIIALEYLRDPASGKSLCNMPDLVERVVDTFSEADLTALGEVAAVTGSIDTLHTFLEAVAVPGIEYGKADFEAFDDWRLRTELGASTAWVVRLGRLPLWRWPSAVWHAIMLSDEEVASYHQVSGETLRSARWRRFKRGVRQFPPAVAGFLRFRFANRRNRA